MSLETPYNGDNFNDDNDSLYYSPFCLNVDIDKNELEPSFYDFRNILFDETSNTTSNTQNS